MKKVTIEISGYGGEHTIGTLTNEQADFWKNKNSDELETHITSWEFDDNETNIGTWYEVDNVDHTYGCVDVDDVFIKFGDETYNYKSIYDFETEEPSYVDYMDLDPDTPHLMCYQEDRGVFFNAEFEVEDDEVFSLENFTIITKEILGDDFVIGVKYKDTELDNLDSDTISKGFSAKIFYPNEI